MYYEYLLFISILCIFLHCKIIHNLDRSYKHGDIDVMMIASGGSDLFTISLFHSPTGVDPRGKSLQGKTSATVEYFTMACLLHICEMCNGKV